MAAAPAAPTDLKIDSQTAGNIQVSWKAPESVRGSPLTGYKVYFKDIVAGTEVSESVSAVLLSKALTADKQYAIRVAAINIEGESEATDNVYGYSAAVPSALTIATVTERADKSIKLSWTAPTSSLPILGYRVYRNTGDDSYPSILAYNGEEVPSLRNTLIEDLRSGIVYRFGWKAINSVGESTMSPILETRIGSLPSPPERPPTHTSSTVSSISFKWEPTTQSGGGLVEKYHVYMNNVKISSYPASTLSHSVTVGLTAGTSYSFAISAESNIGEGIKSHASLFWAIDTPAKPVPVVEMSTRDSCSIKWPEVTAPTHSVIEGYVFKINNGLDGSDFEVSYDGSHDSSSLTATLNNLEPRRTYSIVGYAINKAGLGLTSDPVTCFTTAPPGQPGRPNRVTSTDTTIDLQWDPAFEDGGSPISEYQLYMDVIEGLGVANTESWSLIHNSNSLSYQVTGLTALKQYRFRVRSKSGSLVLGEWSPISEYYASPLPPTPAFDTSATKTE